MSSVKKYYYTVFLEVALKTSERVFGFINISHIPYRKLEELFRDQITFENALFDDTMSYFIEEELYNKHKEYLDKEIPFTFDFDIFEYSVSLGCVEINKYKKNYHEEPPQPLYGNPMQPQWTFYN